MTKQDKQMWYLIRGGKTFKNKIKFIKMGWIKQLGESLIGQGATTFLGNLFGNNQADKNDERQLEQQRKLQDLGIEGSQKMGRFNQALALEMWDKTNIPAQVEQYKKAGMNPGLMYGMGGGGGTTASTPPGNVGQADAPKGGHEQIDTMGIQMSAAQLGLLNAQRENIEADTKNKEAGAKNTEADTLNKPKVGKNIEADTALKEINWNIQAIEEDIKGETQNAQKAIIMSNLRTITAQMHMAERDQKVSQETAQTAIDTAKAELAKIYVQNALTKAQEKATEIGSEKMKKEIEMIKKQVGNFDNAWELHKFIENEKVRLMDKGINVAIISATLGSILNFVK